MQDRKREGPTPIDQILRSVLRESGLSGTTHHERIFRAWTEALDPAQRERTVPVRFRRGELVVEVGSAALLQELGNFTGESVRQKANQRLGSERIRKVVFKLRG